MKKTLLLAAALACSGVAQAETYVCTSTFGAAINEDMIVVEGLPVRTWVADTRRGLRIPDPLTADSYSGECEVMGRTEIGGVEIICRSSELGQHHSIMIQKLSTRIKFNASYFFAFNFSFSGNCTEI